MILKWGIDPLSMRRAISVGRSIIRIMPKARGYEIALLGTNGGYFDNLDGQFFNSEEEAMVAVHRAVEKQFEKGMTFESKDIFSKRLSLAVDHYIIGDNSKELNLPEIQKDIFMGITHEEIIGYKKAICVYSMPGGRYAAYIDVVKCRIPKGSAVRLSHIPGGKCRAEKVEILDTPPSNQYLPRGSKLFRIVSIYDIMRPRYQGDAYDEDKPFYRLRTKVSFAMRPITPFSQSDWRLSEMPLYELLEPYLSYLYSYTPGDMLETYFDPSNDECAAGFHFFRTKDSARYYDFT